MSKEYKLPQAESSDWVKRSLAGGPSLTLAKFVDKSLDLRRWSYSTFARDGFSGNQLLDFDRGGRVASQDADNWLAQRLKSIAGARRAAFIAEDWRASPSSEFLRRRRMPAIFRDAEVYYCVDSRSIGVVPNWHLILSNTVPAFHAFLFEECEMLSALAIDQELTDCRIMQLLPHLLVVVCGAYDGEGYIIALAPDVA